MSELKTQENGQLEYLLRWLDERKLAIEGVDEEQLRRLSIWPFKTMHDVKRGFFKSKEDLSERERVELQRKEEKGIEIKDEHALELIIELHNEGKLKKYLSPNRHAGTDFAKYEKECFIRPLSMGPAELQEFRELLLLIYCRNLGQTRKMRGVAKRNLLMSKARQSVLKYRSSTGIAPSIDLFDDHLDSFVEELLQIDFSIFYWSGGSELAEFNTHMKKAESQEDKMKVLNGVDALKARALLKELRRHLEKLPNIPFDLYFTASDLHHEIESDLMENPFDGLVVRKNVCFIDDIVDSTGACVFGPYGHSREASLAYVLDENIELLSLVPYFEATDRSPWPAIAKAILVKTFDYEDKSPVLLVDGIVGGSAIKSDPLNRLAHKFMLEGIFRYAQAERFKRLVVNLDHGWNRSQNAVHQFTMEFWKLAHVFSEGKGYWQCNRALPLKSDEEIFGVKKRDPYKIAKMLYDIVQRKCARWKVGEFKGTHVLQKPKMPNEIIRQVGMPDYRGQQYSDAWYGYYAGIRYPQWTLCKGPIVGIEFDVEHMMSEYFDHIKTPNRSDAVHSEQKPPSS